MSRPNKKKNPNAASIRGRWLPRCVRWAYIRTSTYVRLLQHFTCCNGFYLYATGCVSHDRHTPRMYAVGELEDAWELHPTPRATGSGVRRAVALDCETGTSFTGDSELIRVSLIDYFSGEILVDSLVYPTVAMQHLNTRYSGVTRGLLEVARRANRCLAGRDDARQRLWGFVGPETVVVMHGGKADLLALRWIYRAVIDTYVVEWRREMGQPEAVPETARGDDVRKSHSKGRARQRGGRAGLSGSGSLVGGERIVGRSSTKAAPGATELDRTME